MNEETIITTLQNFAHAFDNKEWQQLKECLLNEIWTDYSSFRATEPGFISRSKYIHQRKTGLKNLQTIHLLRNFEIQRDQEQANCKCNFVIKRFKANTYYHSYGTYNFKLVLLKGMWKIAKIVQSTSKSEGDKSIHGAFK